MSREIVRTPSEVEGAIGDIEDRMYGEGGSRFPGMSYEEGASAFYRWLIGDTEEHPYEE